MLKKLIGLGVLLAFVAFWTTLATARMLLRFLKSPKAFFTVKKRATPPRTLTDGWKHAYAQLPEVKLHYVAAGKPDQPLMLMLHGFPEFWYSWRHQLREFQNDYRVVAVDMRGYGDSEKPDGVDKYRMEKLVKDVREFILALGKNSCILVAHDWGAVVAWQFALSHPELVDKLIILNCPHPTAFRQLLRGGSLKQLLKSWYMFFFQCPYLPEMNLRANDLEFFEKVFTEPPSGCRNPKAFTAEDIEAWKYTFSQPGALTPPLNYYRSAIRGMASGKGTRTAIVQPPTLIIWGTEDVALDTKLAELSAANCRQVTLQYVEGASHWVQQDEPTICNRHIRDFLKGSL